MFPTVVGIVPDTMYCDCWQAKLAEMIGPYRRRHSRIVTFLDPEDVDVNFVPNDAWDESHVPRWSFQIYIYFIFTPKMGGRGGNDPIWRAYFSNGLVQPPTSVVFCEIQREEENWMVWRRWQGWFGEIGTFKLGGRIRPHRRKDMILLLSFSKEWKAVGFSRPKAAG